MLDFATALRDVADCWPALVPPNRISVTEGARALKIARPGGGSMHWSAEKTPYMVEPMNVLASRSHNSLVFVSGSQCGKTVGLGEGWFTHTQINDPGDMAIIQMTKEKAREYSQQRIDRAIRNTPELKAILGGKASDDNIHDKQFRNGAALRLLWPTVTNLSSSAYRYIFGTDYDRWPDDIDGEGDGFTMMLSRIKTYLSRGMACIETTPGRPITQPDWRPSSPHEAPPVKGALGVYNNSDRRRYYWQCPHCRAPFQASPGLGLFHLPQFEELEEEIRTLDIGAMSKQYARVVCPEGCLVDFEHRYEMNAAGIWLPEGCELDERGRVSGNPRQSSTAGFWLGGLAAAYLTWETIIERYLQGILQYVMTGDENGLLTTTNVDQGMPYMPRSLADASRGGASPEDRAEKDLEQYVVPPEARFLVTRVDVQGGANARFICETSAVGLHSEQWLIDRWAITQSEREGYGGKAPLDPARHVEDWEVLAKIITERTYRCDEGREMRVHHLIVDTGGEDGVADKVYRWWRTLRERGLHNQVTLAKGHTEKGNWWIRETWVGGRDQDHNDVRLHLLNSNLFKDAFFNNLNRQTPGPSYIHLPAPRSDKNPDGWLLKSYFEELGAEVRQENGKYEKVRARNEAIDCGYMGLAALMRLGVDKRGFWDNPPSWARPWDQNINVITAEQRRAEHKAAEAKTPAQGGGSKGLKRSVGRSSYVGGG